MKRFQNQRPRGGHFQKPSHGSQREPRENRNPNQAGNASQFIRWGPRLVMRWESPDKLKEIGVHLQQWFGGADFWNAVPSQLPDGWMKNHPEEHYVWLKWSPKPYRGFLVFFPYHGRNWSILLVCSDKPGEYELYFLKFRLDTQIYQGTWWVVEMTPSTDPSQHYKVWLEDCWFLEGTDMRGLSVEERTEKARRVWEQKWQPDPALESVALHWKPACKASQMGSMLRFLYGLRGQMPMNQVRFWITSHAPTRKPTQDILSCFQLHIPVQDWADITTFYDEWKVQNQKEQARKEELEKTVAAGDWNPVSSVFACWKTKYPDIYELSSLDKEGDRGISIGLACVPNIQTSLAIRKWFQQESGGEGEPESESLSVIWIRAQWHPWFGRWVPTQLASSDEITQRKILQTENPKGKPPQRLWLPQEKWFSYPVLQEEDDE